ncbi:hypothetical protein [Bradyrhizobium sp. CCBAU 11361]|nr:hypothetical protein [Bradyrhizobium sp. CCBAU 11361]
MNDARIKAIAALDRWKNEPHEDASAPILLDCATIPGSNPLAISGLGRHP